METGIKTRTTVPSAAARLAALLSVLGHTKGNPCKPEDGEEAWLSQTQDMPGYLGFVDGKVTAVWEEDGTLFADLAEENGSADRNIPIMNTVNTYPGGQTEEFWWSGKGLDILLGRLRTEHPKEYLEALLRRAVPVGRLLLPEGTEVGFLNTKGEKETFTLLSVGSDEGRATVSYTDGEDTFTDYARDLAPEDIEEVLRATGHPEEN